MIGVIWWMYGGYAWLTNAVRADVGFGRLLLLGGMAGFMILALAIPTTFDGDGLVFGIGYAVVIAIHRALFLRASPAIGGGVVSGSRPVQSRNRRPGADRRCGRRHGPVRPVRRRASQ